MQDIESKWFYNSSDICKLGFRANKWWCGLDFNSHLEDRQSRLITTWVNTQNCLISGTEKQHALIEKFIHDLKVTVWCGSLFLLSFDFLLENQKEYISITFCNRWAICWTLKEKIHASYAREKKTVFLKIQVVWITHISALVTTKKLCTESLFSARRASKISWSYTLGLLVKFPSNHTCKEIGLRHWPSWKMIWVILFQRFILFKNWKIHGWNF